MIDLIENKITGTNIAYFIICKRKMWLFTHQIEMEKYSDYVEIGKLISEESFKKERYKEVLIGETLKLDFLKMGNEIIVHEIKKSRKMEEAHIWQVKFYIYSLRRLGINSHYGVIHYPKLMKKIDVELTEEDEKEIERALKEIEIIKRLDKPPEIINKPYCKKCAYYFFCFI
ncbi:MAG: CRISPR-associated protein Cas4 [candidate division WOR-3 bacterium]|nr:CRISPR-associated protein Cas4 [candidate division WOR-3 bacterium]MCX7837735.1 CRISPR-associated protein Cas4 [candidate division WOR-3 bacterium]MDW8114487.1 CRISPR-associated protein Cas4 [candidate division WOR-3 bacterium]